MRNIVNRTFGLVLAVCVVMLGSTTMTFFTAASRFDARAEQFDSSGVDASSVLVDLWVNERSCGGVTYAVPDRSVRSEATCAFGRHPVRVYVLESVFDLSEKLNDGSFAAGCRPAGDRHYVIDGLIVFRTTSRAVAASIAESRGGFSFTTRCRSRG